LTRLSAVLRDPLLADFIACRNPIASFLGATAHFVDDPSSRAKYDAFVHKTLQDGLAGFWQRAPAAARLACAITANWISAASEFLERLAADIGAIRTRFDLRGDVTGVSAGLSDPHRHGRSVL